jgi:hypothetical protein
MVDGRHTIDATFDGFLEVNTRRRTLVVTNRCCAGTQGTTTRYRVRASGDLSLERVSEWSRNSAGRRRTNREYEAPR